MTVWSIYGRFIARLCAMTQGGQRLQTSRHCLEELLFLRMDAWDPTWLRLCLRLLRELR
jgi:hypothetical protein